MKVYVNRFPVNGPWGGGNLWVRGFHKFAPDLGASLVKPESFGNAPDIILIAGLDNDGYGISAEQAVMYKSMMEGKKDIKLILRVNENDARKGTTNVDATLMRLMPHMDGIIFVSSWLRSYFAEQGWNGKNDTVILNGVDKDVFKSQPKLNNGKLNIVAHHWSDNVMKGFDIYEELDEFIGQNPDKYAFTYIGRDRRTFKHTNVVRPLHGNRLGEELGKHDLYVSASRWDPGPNHILEALSCNLPTYVHRDGGGCVEFANASHAYENWDHLKQILVGEQLILPNLSVVDLQTWQACVREYIGFLETTCKGP